MQGIWDLLFFVFLSALSGLVAFFGGRSINRKRFSEAIASGKPLHLCLAGHKGAFHLGWFLTSVGMFLIISLVASMLGSELLRFDFDSNILLAIAVVVGVLALGGVGTAIRKMDRVPPLPTEREGAQR